MANTFNKTSFIPQKSLKPSGPRKTSSLDLFFIIGVILFLIALFGSIGVVVYKEVVRNGIESRAASLQRAREAFDPSLIEELARLDNRIEMTKGVLATHISLTPMFAFVEELTLKNVKFDNLEFNATNSGDLFLSMSGQAVNYATIVLQSDTLGESRFLRDQIFSNINLDASGNVGFSFNATINPDLVSFSGNLEDI